MLIFPVIPINPKIWGIIKTTVKISLIARVGISKISVPASRRGWDQDGLCAGRHFKMFVKLVVYFQISFYRTFYEGRICAA